MGRNKELMKTIALILGLTTAALAQQPTRSEMTKDVDGWSKAKWGMAEAEVWQAFQGEAVRFPERRNYKNTYATIGIPDYRIGNYRFKVMFMLDSKTNLLTGVNIQPFDQDVGGLLLGNYRGPVPDGPGPEALFDELKPLLTQKYGQPTSSETSRTNEHIAVWRFPTTTIQLNYSTVLGIRSMVLNYRKNQKSDLDKI
jgi:hypothetical protein